MRLVPYLFSFSSIISLSFFEQINMYVCVYIQIIGGDCVQV